MPAQSEIVNNTVQSLLLSMSSASSNKNFINNIYNTPISKIPIIGSNYSKKSDRVFPVFYKNVNSLYAEYNS